MVRDEYQKRYLLEIEPQTSAVIFEKGLFRELGSQRPTLLSQLSLFSKISFSLRSLPANKKTGLHMQPDLMGIKTVSFK